jgi:RNA polymerase sigma-70 factor, ECF subfamily
MSHVQKITLNSSAAPPAELSARAASAEAERLLVRRAQGGDQSAYEQLVRIHQQRILAVVSGILRRSEDVEDVAQQAMVKAYFSLKRFDQRSAFGTWLYKIAVNECWDYFRKKKARHLVYESDLNEEQVRQMEGTTESDDGVIVKHTENAESRVERRDLIDRLLIVLEPQDRAMLVMKEVQGFTVEEIGDILDLNVNTVKVRLFRARGRLAKAYRRLRERKPARPRKA